MNICMCGAQAGYPHDAACPWPLYRNDEEAEALWRAAYEAAFEEMLAEDGTPADSVAGDET